MIHHPHADLQDLLDRVRSYCQHACPGEVAVEVRIVLASGRKVTHPVPAFSASRGRMAPFRHSDDFRSVVWGEQHFTFSILQAACVRVLWEAMEQGTPDMSQAAVLTAAESDSNRLRDLFATHPAFGTLIVQGQGKGTYRLRPPAEEEP